MTKNKAIKLAIEALKKYRHTFSVEHNLHTKMDIKTPITRRHHKKYKELTEAINVLEAL